MILAFYGAIIMSLEKIHLRKLLKFLFLPEKNQISEIKKDINQDKKKESDNKNTGGDFYVPFWSDAKNHVFNLVDIHDSTKLRVESNIRRNRLYVQLERGFLDWWNQYRSNTNEPFQQGDDINSHFHILDVNLIIKIDNFLSFVDRNSKKHFVYPYFAEKPKLNDDSARIGLWIITSAFSDIPPDEISILDVLGGLSFSLLDNYLIGNEEDEFKKRYNDLLRLRDRVIRKEI